MTIRRGQAWGAPANLPAGAPIVGTDAAAAAEVVVGGPPVTVGLTGGDLFRTLGGQPGARRWDDGAAMAFPVDAMEVNLDGTTFVGVAHLVVTGGRKLWSRPTLVVMNAAFVGSANLGPRSHPNDGRLDVTEGALPRGERVRGRRRMAAGAHLPHPELHESRVAELERDIADDSAIRLDGIVLGTARRLVVRAVPDAFVAVV